MRFKTRIAMESTPGFDMDAALAPIGVNALVRGRARAALDTFRIGVGRIPVRLAIPFLKRRRPPLFVSVGPFRVRVSPLRFTTEGLAFRLDGVIGTDGISGELAGTIDCKTGMTVDGQLGGKASRLTLALEEAEDEEDGDLHEGHEEHHEHEHEHEHEHGHEHGHEHEHEHEGEHEHGREHEHEAETKPPKRRRRGAARRD